MSIQRPSLLVLIRHAESERNRVKRGSVYFADDEARAQIRGIPDHEIPITSEGVEQARATGLAVRKEFGAPDYVYHSGYKRTIQTTEEMLRAYSAEERELINLRHNVFVRERDSGHAYDMTEAESAEAFPWLKEHWATYGGFFARPPGGESLADVVERVYVFLNMLFRDRAGKRVFVVTHGGTLRCFRFVLERWNYEQALKSQILENCGVTVYQYDQKQRRLMLQQCNTVHWR